MLDKFIVGLGIWAFSAIVVAPIVGRYLRNRRSDDIVNCPVCNLLFPSAGEFGFVPHILAAHPDSVQARAIRGLNDAP